MLAARCSLLLYINHVATCDGLWLVARSLLDLSLADICGLTLDILSVHFFFALFAACLCAIWVSASGRRLYSCRLIRTNRKYENSSLGRTCIQCKPISTSHELCAVALAGIYWFSHADQGPTAKINDKLQETNLQQTFKTHLRTNCQKFVLTIILSYVNICLFISNYKLNFIVQFIWFIYQNLLFKNCIFSLTAASEGNLFCVLIITSCIIWISLIEYWYKLINCLSGAQCYYT